MTTHIAWLEVYGWGMHDGSGHQNYRICTQVPSSVSGAALDSWIPLIMREGIGGSIGQKLPEIGGFASVEAFRIKVALPKNEARLAPLVRFVPPTWSDDMYHALVGDVDDTVALPSNFVTYTSDPDGTTYGLGGYHFIGQECVYAIGATVERGVLGTSRAAHFAGDAVWAGGPPFLLGQRGRFVIQAASETDFTGAAPSAQVMEIVISDLSIGSGGTVAEIALASPVLTLMPKEHVPLDSVSGRIFTLGSTEVGGYDLGDSTADVKYNRIRVGTRAFRADTLQPPTGVEPRGYITSGDPRVANIAPTDYRLAGYGVSPSDVIEVMGENGQDIDGSVGYFFGEVYAADLVMAIICGQNHDESIKVPSGITLGVNPDQVDAASFTPEAEGGTAPNVKVYQAFVGIEHASELTKLLKPYLEVMGCGVASTAGGGMRLVNLAPQQKTGITPTVTQSMMRAGSSPSVSYSVQVTQRLTVTWTDASGTIGQAEPNERRFEVFGSPRSANGKPDLYTGLVSTSQRHIEAPMLNRPFDTTHIDAANAQRITEIAESLSVARPLVSIELAAWNGLSLSVGDVVTLDMPGLPSATGSLSDGLTYFAQAIDIRRNFLDGSARVTFSVLTELRNDDLWGPGGEVQSGTTTTATLDDATGFAVGDVIKLLDNDLTDTGDTSTISLIAGNVLTFSPSMTGAPVAGQYITLDDHENQTQQSVYGYADAGLTPADVPEDDLTQWRP